MSWSPRPATLPQLSDHNEVVSLITLELGGILKTRGPHAQAGKKPHRSAVKSPKSKPASRLGDVKHRCQFCLEVVKARLRLREQEISEWRLLPFLLGHGESQLAPAFTDQRGKNAAKRRANGTFQLAAGNLVAHRQREGDPHEFQVEQRRTRFDAGCHARA